MHKFPREIKILLLIFLFALGLRIYKLGEFPVGFHADEARVGWNALSILKTGKDDRGNRFALYYNTFGDYRPTGIFYLTIPSIIVFGRNEFAVRFPSALFGALTVFPVYFLAYEIAKNKKLALLSAFFISIPAWHISTSRATSEVVISLFFDLFGIYFFLKGVSTRLRKFFLLSIVSFAIGYFFYHTVRLRAPLSIGVLILYFWKEIRKSKLLKPSILTFVSLALLTATFLVQKESRGRFSQISIFNDLNVQYELVRMPFEEGPGKVFIARLFHNKLSVYARRFISEYVKYVSADFLFGDTEKPARYRTPVVGLLGYFEALFLFMGLIAVAQKKGSSLPFILMVLAPIPAALTTEDAPNLHRALFMIPFIAIIESYGFAFLSETTKKRRWILSLAILGLAANMVFYLHMYYVHAKNNLPLYRNIGAKELALELNRLKKDYDKIVITNIPDDPYPWVAFFTGEDPGPFNKEAIKREKGPWSVDNFYFTALRCPSDDIFAKPDVKRLLVVDAEGCFEKNKVGGRAQVLEEIKRPDESVVYTLWSRIE